MEQYYTLITGSSSGIGKSLALECARRGMNILLVALPGPELEQTVSELKSKFTIEVSHFPVDLTGIEAPKSVFEWCMNQNFKVNFLINNAGITGTTSFEKSEPEYSDLRIMLNIRAMTLLTRYFIPMLKQYPGSKILNMGSMSGFFPVPYKTVYSASKAFVQSFSRSLSKELERSGIGVFIVCPNGVETNPLTATRIKTHGRWSKLTTIESERLAKLTLDNIEKGKRIYIPLLMNRLLLFVGKMLPEKIKLSLLEKEFREELNY
jgi:short-subunit dehydrogenase